jgi:hypothetical protein
MMALQGQQVESASPGNQGLEVNFDFYPGRQHRLVVACRKLSVSQDTETNSRLEAGAR